MTLLRFCLVTLTALAVFRLDPVPAWGESSVDDALATLLGRLDPAGIPTGILYDRVLPMSRIAEHDGGEASPPTTLGHWRQMYHEISRASLDADALPALGAFMDRGRQWLDDGAIPLLIMDFHYHRIRPDALDDGSIVVEDGRLVIGDGTPFERRRVFAAASIADYTHRGEAVVFSLERELYLTNNDVPPDAIEIDLDDGRGLRAMHLGARAVVHYATTGRKVLRVRVTRGDETLHGSFYFDVAHLQTPTPDDTMNVTASTSYNGEFGTGEAYVYLSDLNTELTNPIVVVEGFDIDDTMNWDELYQLLNQAALVDTIRARGFDLVVLNFTQATDYIQKNAFVITELIDEILLEIDPQKTLVLVGASMGGLAGRYALAYMEDQAINHRVRTFISFDAPHKGANIPLGVQYWLTFFYHLWITHDENAPVRCDSAPGRVV